MKLSKKDIDKFGDILTVNSANSKCASEGKITPHTFYTVSNGQTTVIIAVCDSCSEAKYVHGENG